jgi:glutathione S-transferase
MRPATEETLMMKLYGALASPYVARVVLVARYKKLELPLEMPAGGIKSPAYLAKNPFGKMPTLEHGDRCIIESEVICEYLDELHPRPGILPGDAFMRARARTVSRVVDLYVAPESNVMFRQLDPATRDVAAVEAGKARLAESVRILDGLMDGGGWAVGDFSLADCNLLPAILVIRKVLAPALGVADPTGAGPGLAAWWTRVNADPMTSAFVTEYAAAIDAFLARPRTA